MTTISGYTPSGTYFEIGDAKDALISQIGFGGTTYKRPNCFIGNKTSLTIPANMQVCINDKGYYTDEDIVLSIDSFVSAANRAGKDVYVYACESSTTVPTFVVSLNSTVPSGYTATNSRKIGGFHCLCLAVGTISGHPLSGYATGDILPNSEWDLLHRPVAKSEGMVYTDLGIWADIYLPSTDSDYTSGFGKTVLDGSSSPKFNGSQFAEAAGKVGKRLISYDEFTVLAKGSNENTNINGGTDPGTTGGHVDTANRRMISNYGLEDCCGVYWQWSSTLFEYFPGATATNLSENNSVKWLTGYSWQQYSVYNSDYDSQKYGSCSGFLRRALLGGRWVDGSGCGSRCAYCNVFSSYGNGNLSARFVSEPRVVIL